MRCGEAEEKWLLRQSGELDAAQKAALDAHVEGCERCRDSAQERQALLDAVGRVPSMPPVLARGILARAARIGAVQAASRRRRFVRRLGLAACLCLAAVFFFASVSRDAPADWPANADRSPGGQSGEEVIGHSSDKLANRIESLRNELEKGLPFAAGDRCRRENGVRDIKERIQTVRQELTALAVLMNQECE
jgi:hypothetical protein